MKDPNSSSSSSARAYTHVRPSSIALDRADSSYTDSEAWGTNRVSWPFACARGMDSLPTAAYRGATTKTDASTFSSRWAMAAAELLTETKLFEIWRSQFRACFKQRRRQKHSQDAVAHPQEGEFGDDEVESGRSEEGGGQLGRVVALCSERDRSSFGRGVMVSEQGGGDVEFLRGEARTTGEGSALDSRAGDLRMTQWPPLSPPLLLPLHLPQYEQVKLTRKVYRRKLSSLSGMPTMGSSGCVWTRDLMRPLIVRGDMVEARVGVREKGGRGRRGAF